MPLEDGPGFKAWEERQADLRAAEQPEKGSFFSRLRNALPHDFFGREDRRMTEESRSRMRERLQQDVLGEADSVVPGTSAVEEDAEGQILELGPEYVYTEEAPQIPEAIKPEPAAPAEEPEMSRVSEAEDPQPQVTESRIAALDLRDVAREKAARGTEAALLADTEEEASGAGEETILSQESEETKLKKTEALDLSSVSREKFTRQASSEESGDSSGEELLLDETMAIREGVSLESEARGEEVSSKSQVVPTEPVPEAVDAGTAVEHPAGAVSPEILPASEPRAKRTGRRRQEERNANREMKMEEAEQELRRLAGENNYSWPHVFADRSDLRKRIRFLKADPGADMVHFKHGDEDHTLSIDEFLAAYTPEKWLKTGIDTASETPEGTESSVEPEMTPESAAAGGEEAASESPEDLDSVSALEAARRTYAEEEYKKRSAWKTLKSMFKVEMPEDDPDLAVYRDAYKDALKQYQKTRLEEAGTDPEALSALMRYSALDEALNLREAYDSVRLERASLAGKTLEALKGFGRTFNSLPLKYKLPVYAAGIGLVSLGGAAAVAGGSIIALRKIAATLGAAATAEMLIEKGMQRSLRKGAERQIEALADENGESSIADIEQFLDAQAEATDQRLAKFKKQNFVKWAGAFGAGALVASFSSFMSSDGAAPSGSEAPSGGGSGLPPDPALDNPPSAGVLEEHSLDAAHDAGDQVSPDGPVYEEEGTASGPGGAPDPESAGESQPQPSSEAASGQSPEASEAEPSASEAPVAEQAAGPSEILVTEAHQAQGLWGILEHQLGDDMEVADRNRAVVALERLIQEKLENMTPDEQAAAGFRSGDINTIYAGDTLRLDSLVSAEEWQQAVSGGEMPGSEAAASEAASSETVSPGAPESAPEAVPSPEPASEAPVESAQPEPAPNAAEASVESHYTVEQSRPAAFRAEHPELTDALRREMLQERLALFRTPEVSEAEFRALTERIDSVSRIRVDRILNTFEHLQEDPRYTYSPRTNPLHISQMARVATLTERAEALFGEAGRVQEKERLWEYTGRIATLVMRRRLEDPNFQLSLTP